MCSKTYDDQKIVRQFTALTFIIASITWAICEIFGLVESVLYSGLLIIVSVTVVMIYDKKNKTAYG